MYVFKTPKPKRNKLIPYKLNHLLTYGKMRGENTNNCDINDQVYNLAIVLFLTQNMEQVFTFNSKAKFSQELRIFWMWYFFISTGKNLRCGHPLQKFIFYCKKGVNLLLDLIFWFVPWLELNNHRSKFETWTLIRTL